MWWLFLPLLHASPYSEDLHLIPYSGATVLAGFRFSWLWQEPELSGLVTNFEYFPPFLPDAMHRAQSSFWEVTLTQGQKALFADEMLHTYNQQANTTFALHESGLTVRTDTSTDWPQLSLFLSALICSPLSTFKTSQLDGQQYLHAHDFNCKENLVNVIKLLPCRDGKGLGQALKDVLYGSGYSHIVHRGGRGNGVWRYEVEILAEVPAAIPFRIRKDGVCLNSTVHYPEGSTFKTASPEAVPFKELTLPYSEPIAKCVSLGSERRLGGDLHSFEALYQHEVHNCLDAAVQVTVLELFPLQTTPLLSSLVAGAGNWTVNRGAAGWEFTFSFTLNPGETVRVKLKLLKVMQSFEQYPSDPQRGWDVPSTPLSYVYRGVRYEQPTSRLLIMIPEPDFSMPFNVMCVACSLISFYFTSLQSFILWKRPTHWSSPRYEDEVVKAERVKKYARWIFLGVTVAVIFVLDYYGIVKVF